MARKTKQPLSADLKTTLVGVGSAALTGGLSILSTGNLDWKAYVGMLAQVLVGVLTNRNTLQ